jgi:DNA polymerase (family 10)
MEEANPFRVRAYRQAADSIEEYSSSVAAIARTAPERLAAIRGVGAALAHRIEEFIRSGQLRTLEDPERRALVGAAELLRVPGIGPTRARMLAQRFGIRSLDELSEKAQSGQLRDLPGFGARSEQKVLRDIDALKRSRRRFLRAAAAPQVDTLLHLLREIPGVGRVAIGGSFRRRLETSGNLNLVASAASAGPVLEAFASQSRVRHVVTRRERGVSVELRTGIEADLHIVDDESFGVNLFCRTGSQAHTSAIRTLARERGLRIGEDGIFRGAERLSGREEADVYAAVGLPWIPPELREGRGEVEAAREGRLPALIAPDQVRGDLQCHTTDSDGRATLEQMARAAESLGYEYLAVTDHTPALRIVQGLDGEGFRRQWERIDELNSRLTGLTVLKGAEVDIHEDGSLDLDDATLAGFDIVLVSLHSSLSLPAEKQTRRVVRALSHGLVDVFAHPTGRIIGRRPPAAFDPEAVFRVATEHGVMIEVNGSPDRLDLDDLLCRAAIEQGVRITLGTDAHSVAELRNMRWAVDQTRRAWARRDDVVNTLSLTALRSELRQKR